MQPNTVRIGAALVHLSLIIASILAPLGAWLHPVMNSALHGASEGTSLVPEILSDSPL